MKSDKTIIRKTRMEQLDYIKDSLDIKDPNITFEKTFDKFFTHREYHAKLDYDAPQCPACQGKMTTYDPFQEKQEKHFFELISDTIKRVHPIFKTVFSTFLKDKEKIINALFQRQTRGDQQPY